MRSSGLAPGQVDAAGAAAAAQAAAIAAAAADATSKANAAIAASQPADADLSAISAQTNATYGLSLLTLADQPALQAAVGASGGASGVVLYPDPLNASDLAGYKTMTTTPSAAAETTLTAALTGTGWVLIEEFATDPGVPGVTSLPAGQFTRDFYVATGGSNQLAKLKTEIYSCASDGSAETLLRTVETTTFAGTAIQEINETFVSPTAFALALTDRLVLKLYGARVSGPTTCDLVVYFDDEIHTSHIHTTIPASAPVTGALADLTTTARTNLVAAINEVNARTAPHVAAAAPTANDDSGDGHFVGAAWIDTSASPAAVYICTDATPTAAVWWTASGGGSTMLIGHSYDRLDPVTAGAGARFFDQDNLVAYTSTGVAWVVEYGGAFGPDKAGLLCTSAGVYLASINGSAYTLGNITVAILFYLDSTIAADKAIGAFGARSAAHGVEILLGTSGGNTLLRSFQNGTFTTIKTFAGALPVGLHCVCVSAIAGSKWRFSFDGEAVADVSLGTAYATPTLATLGFGISSSPDVPLPGKAIAMGVWNAQLSDADIVALATLPGTPTYRLPITASTGIPAFWVEANRYDEMFPTQLRVRGTTPLTVQPGVRKWRP